MARKKKRLKNKVSSFFREPFKTKEKKIIPDPYYPNLQKNNTGIICDLAFLFADIRCSSSLHKKYGIELSASIYKAFHEINVHFIEHYHGRVRAFDGDRIMGVFGKKGKASHAVASGMHILGAIRELLNAELATGINVGVGIDRGETLITKVGKGKDPNNQDLIWVGTSCNIASHLSEYGNNEIYATEDVFSDLREGWIYDVEGNQMWETTNLRVEGFEGVEIYKSGYSA